MWTTTNRTPYQAASIWGRDKNGVHEWIVAVKGTFNIKTDGSLKIADEQLKPLLLPEYNAEAGASSLRYDADLAATKPTTDVVLNGTAYAPKGRPSTDFLISIRVDRMRKAIRAFGNRRWMPGPIGGRPSVAEPVTQLPIVYERAYGGYDHTDHDPRNHRLDTRNPVGCGVVARLGNRVGAPMPNFEHLDGNLEHDGPAGFGALDSYWSPRREHGGTYDEAWERDRRPLLPKDWDSRSLLCSPADQRPDTYLQGGELVELVNLTPDGFHRFALPKAKFTFSTRFGRRVEEHGSQLATVIIEPDHRRVIMVWLSSLACRADADYLDKTIVWEEPDV